MIQCVADYISVVTVKTRFYGCERVVFLVVFERYPREAASSPVASELVSLCVYMCGSVLLCEEFLLSSG